MCPRITVCSGSSTNSTLGIPVAGNALLVSRLSCTFALKASVAQAVNASLVVFYACPNTGAGACSPNFVTAIGYALGRLAPLFGPHDLLTFTSSRAYSLPTARSRPASPPSTF
jgi:hypothetical protein